MLSLCNLDNPFQTDPSGKTNDAPVLLYVGRVAVEKGIEQFLRAQVKGTKRVVGDGPSRKSLEPTYPQAEFVGYRENQSLVDEFRKGDVFVFRSVFG